MPPAKKTRSLAFRLVRGLFAAIAGAYLLMVGAIWYAQAKIIFHPSRIVDVTPGDLGVKFNNVTLPLKGDQLAGWWVPSERTRRREPCSTCMATLPTWPPMSTTCCAFA